ncbi:uncharacterized protein [Amphiura filiformis]|uniref:uncharacterized protein n=1 Tax=Amphiura filiformis TaxID=82378 RepID=UPI003B218C2E
MKLTLVFAATVLLAGLEYTQGQECTVDANCPGGICADTGPLSDRVTGVCACTTPGGCRGSACTPNPCQAGGRCIPYGGTYICQCPPNRGGRDCEESRSPAGACGGNPCQNGADCLDYGGSGYTCSCDGGNDGPNCENFNGARPDCGGTWTEPTVCYKLPIIQAFTETETHVAISLKSVVFSRLYSISMTLTVRNSKMYLNMAEEML